MPVSKKRKQNNRPTKSKNISSQMTSSNEPSSRWYVILMSSLMILGVLLIVLNYLTLLPGSVSRWYLWSGLGLIGAGFLMTTNYN
ncbi:MAG: cell division protein CrgA [Candidatus Actinomarinaceae bacterium]|jgi:hypothetical protein|tara:strand:- start:619 stop:873 length:255 start_codon:yes stop_codon:yes gene_type:complete